MVIACKAIISYFKSVLNAFFSFALVLPYLSLSTQKSQQAASNVTAAHKTRMWARVKSTRLEEIPFPIIIQYELILGMSQVVVEADDQLFQAGYPPQSLGTNFHPVVIILRESSNNMHVVPKLI